MRVNRRLHLQILAFVAGAVCAQAMVAQLDVSATSVMHQPSSAPFGPPVGEGMFGKAMAHGDFNGDGFEDLAVTENGTPGRVLILEGSASGLAFADQLTEAAASLFGAALASCDFNEDGFTDLAVGAPNTTVDGVTFAGRVYIYQGSDFGLFFEQTFDQSHPGLDEAPEFGDRFGKALATGVLSTPACDLLVGVPHEDITIGATTHTDAGLVHLIRSSGSGLDPSQSVRLTQESFAGAGETSEPSDGFGTAVAVALDRLGSGRVVISAPGEDLDGVNSAGAVWIRKLSSSSSALITSDDLLSGPPPFNQAFGRTLVVGDFDGVGADDIAIAAPAAKVNGQLRAGRVFVLFFEDSPLLFSSVAVLDEAAPLFLDEPETNDSFGEGLATAQLDGDAYDELVISVPDEEQANGRRGGAPVDLSHGALHIVQFGASGVSAVEYIRRSAIPGVPQEDDFGITVLAADFNGDGGQDLIVAAPNRDNALLGRGSVKDLEQGLIYHIPTPPRLRRAELYLRTGQTLTGASGRMVTELSPPTVDSNGTPAVRGHLDDGESFVYAGAPGAIVFLDSQDPASNLEGEFLNNGIAFHDGEFAYLDRSIPLGRGDSTYPFDELVLYSSNGGILVRGDEVLPGHSSPVGELGRMHTTTAGRTYFSSGPFSGSTDKVLRSGPAMAGPIERVLTQDDTFGLLTVRQVQRFSVSPQENHTIFSSSFDSAAGLEFHLLVDDNVVATVGNTIPGLPGPFGLFDDLDINSAGSFLFATRTDITRLFEGTGGVVEHSLAPEPEIAGVPLAGNTLAAVGLGDGGQRLHLWRRSGVSTYTLLLSCRAIGTGGERVVLRSGDALDLDGNGTSDGTVQTIGKFSGASGNDSLTDDLYLEVELTHGADTYDAILRLDVPCPFFQSGFESGDTEEWNASAP